jgi:hypothetical protein
MMQGQKDIKLLLMGVYFIINSTLLYTSAYFIPFVLLENQQTVRMIHKILQSLVPPTFFGHLILPSSGILHIN